MSKTLLFDWYTDWAHLQLVGDDKANYHHVQLDIDLIFIHFHFSPVYWFDSLLILHINLLEECQILESPFIFITFTDKNKKIWQNTVFGWFDSNWIAYTKTWHDASYQHLSSIYIPFFVWQNPPKASVSHSNCSTKCPKIKPGGLVCQPRRVNWKVKDAVQWVSLCDRLRCNNFLSL